MQRSGRSRDSAARWALPPPPPPRRGIVCRRLSWRESSRIGFAAQAANVLLPTAGAGGLAVSGWALHRAGMDAARIARRSVALFAVASSVNFFTAIAGGALLATGVLGASAPFWAAVAPAGAAIVVLAGAAALPRLLERRGGSGGARGAPAGGLRDARRLWRAGGLQAGGGALGYMGFDLLALVAAFAAIGAAPPLAVVLLAYPLGQLGGLVPLPGGVGGTDGGLVGAFVLYGVAPAEAAAAVLLYRVFQLGLPAALGAAALARLRAPLPTPVPALSAAR
jgi:uncharacterized membrane protein YbhN (UPF0104 family)